MCVRFSYRPSWLPIASFLALSGASIAAPVTVINASFEDPDCDIVVCTNPSNDHSATGWTVIPPSGVAGVFDPDRYGPTSDTPFENEIPDGDQTGFANVGSMLSQALDEALVSDTQYTLTLHVGNRPDDCCETMSYQVRLLAGSTVLASWDQSCFLPAPDTWQVGSVTYLALPDDPSIGTTLAIEIENTASDGQTNFDLVSLEATSLADGDSVPDNMDNCTMVSNDSQLDTDGDGFGNACDADLNNDCAVNFGDLGLMKERFFGNDPDADLDGNGSVNFLDLEIMKVQFFGAPGPSGRPNICNCN